MRLIDADALIEDLNGSLFYSDAIPFVEDAPTAYDVEKVVAELEEASTMDDIDDAFYIREYKAIEIVRKGGIDG